MPYFHDRNAFREVSMTITPELIAAYKSTHFEVHTNEATITLEVDKPNPTFDRLLEVNEADSAVIITAWNPWSKAQSREENNEKQLRLEEQLRKAGFTLIQAAGVDPSRKWESEQSCCALGMKELEGICWGKRHLQNAVIFHQAGKPSKLSICCNYQIDPK